ncbi:hypothetical protein EYZ11_005954 [Aspergillus tanneri]|uniref:Zn(2)-C6 fungal-type domain-containing protein n=1 Tax=Aspergillus tanneri TaxID=1220188 RepID=A0A4S3JH75_9EURO|nr:uncharacterized protein ATNIH1004_002267 [Aspergillus tanneri]KAA8649596.1 hypothetical protein ATNIH1004_002267 [Aspergillus tanneri]THC94555.1 hypothetical protein EYZ11_005954 [Aspergillus tanneri]
MPPRRAHTKSRNGCDQCKRRRVKCDEKGPPCTNCVSRELPCSYMRVPTSRFNTTPSSASPAPVQLLSHVTQLPDAGSRASPITGTISPPTLSRLRELELMHKYSTETYQSLSNEPADYHVWQMILPRKALKFDFLMNGLLAIASLHMASSLQPPEALSYIDMALEYHNRASAPYRLAINNITPDNCDALFAHAIITTIIGISLPRLTADRDASSTMTENIFVVFELLQGVSKILKISRPWLKTNYFTSRHGFFNVPFGTLDPDAEASFEQLTVLNDTLLAGTDTEQHGIMKEAINHLYRCFRRFAHSQDAASVLSWLTTTDKQFVHALRCRQPISFLVLLHWAVLLHGIDGMMWWAKNSGVALGSELLSALLPGDARFERAWRWPKKSLDL